MAPTLPLALRASSVVSADAGSRMARRRSSPPAVTSTMSPKESPPRRRLAQGSRPCSGTRPETAEGEPVSAPVDVRGVRQVHDDGCAGRSIRHGSSPSSLARSVCCRQNRWTRSRNTSARHASMPGRLNSDTSRPRQWPFEWLASSSRSPSRQRERRALSAKTQRPLGWPAHTPCPRDR